MICSAVGRDGAGSRGLIGVLTLGGAGMGIAERSRGEVPLLDGRFRFGSREARGGAVSIGLAGLSEDMSNGLNGSAGICSVLPAGRSVSQPSTPEEQATIRTYIVRCFQTTKDSVI